MATEANRGFTVMKNTVKRKLQRILEKDVEFLRQHGLMGYSLLLGIEKASKEEIED